MLVEIPWKQQDGDPLGTRPKAKPRDAMKSLIDMQNTSSIYRSFRKGANTIYVNKAKKLSTADMMPNICSISELEIDIPTNTNVEKEEKG